MILHAELAQLHQTPEVRDRVRGQGARVGERVMVRVLRPKAIEQAATEAAIGLHVPGGGNQ